MKLLFFIASLRGGGAERVLQLVANELSNRGHHISIATNTDMPFAYDISERVDIVDLKMQWDKNMISRNILFQKRILKITQKYKPDIVITFMTELNVRVLTSLMCTRYPVIASEHTCFKNFKEDTILRYIYRYFINKLATRVTLLTKRDFNFIGNRLNNKIVMPNPLSYSPVDKIGEREKVVLLCGSLDRAKDKGFDKMIVTWSKIAPDFPDWKLYIAGGGSPASVQYLSSIIEKYNIENQVKLLGFQKEVDQYMRSASIFALVSRKEGFSLVLVEAMSQGCACVSFDCVAGPNEIISNDHSDGLLIENQNWDKMKDALITLIENPDLRLRLANNAIHNVGRFSINKIVDQWEYLFNDVLYK